MTMPAPRTAIHARVDACRSGRDPTVVARLQSGWVVMGDPQVLRGYALLLPDPVVPHLNAMPPAGQAAFLADVAAVGQAVLDVTRAVRINYAIFGNVEPALHAHVFPRYADEDPALRTTHPWGYDWTRQAVSMPRPIGTCSNGCVPDSSPGDRRRTRTSTGQAASITSTSP
jgi:diadenosine tetraphosphate (Ap4A) HIT family hydrolase